MKKAALVTPILLLALFYGLWQLANARTFQLFGDIVSRVEIDAPKVALTFDDGPTTAYTEPVLSILREHDVKATFFLIGAEMESYPAGAKRMVAEGHQLGNHSWSHPRFIFKTPGAVAKEIEPTDAAIRAAGYEGEIFFRPPYGKKLLFLPWYLSRTGRTTVTWDVEPETDASVAADAERIAEHVLERVRPGSIILLHVMYESGEQSRKALPVIIDGLRQKGYEFVTLSELLKTAAAR